MPFLRVEAPGKPNVVRIQMDSNTHIRLRSYARFANGTMDSIVSSALNHCFDADKEFLEWEKNPENQQHDSDRSRRKPRSSENGNHSASSQTAAVGGTK